MLHRIVLLILMMALPFGFVQAQTTDNASDFTYQGYLELNGSAVNATCDFTFELYDALIGGNQIGITESASGIVVTEGVFSVQLDFGSSAFNGSDRWLEIGVNDCAGGVTTPLSPRQTITPAAYATYANSAGSVDWGDVNNIPADVADGDDNTEYTAGTGLSLNNNVFSIAASYLLPQCSTTGNIPKWNGTTYICAADNDTQYTAGTGLDLTGTSFSVETNAFWETDGNTGTSVETQFVGTTDNQALVFKVNGLRAFRLEPNNTSPNILGGYNGNLITDDVYGATLSGGGNSGNLNRITDSAGTVSGGVGNTAGNDSGTTFDALYTTVSGGFMNTASAVSSTVGGGDANTASGYRSTINGGGGNNASATGATIGGGEDNIVNGYRGTVGGGATNTASGDTTTIAGGSGNIASGDTAFVGGGKTNIASGNQSSVSGGEINVASGSHATIGGGHNNSVTGGYGTIGGGGSSDSLQGNVVSDNYGTVGGGYSNEAGDGTNADRSAATVGGGYNNTASGSHSTIAGGDSNTASNNRSTVGGGGLNQATGDTSLVAGGSGNLASAFQSTVGGGANNTASGGQSTVAGGVSNSASNGYATVSGGFTNAASGNYSTVPGGDNNTASGNYSFAAGRRAKADDLGAFVWADSASTDIFSPGNNTFSVRASGGIWFGNTSTPSITTGRLIDTSTNAHLTTGGVWTNNSDRNAKTNFESVDGRAVLEAVADMPITTWNYNAEGETVRHIGPMAQDFHAAFGLGNSDTSITTIDADGVALAAIQGLYEVVQEKDAQIMALNNQLSLMTLLSFGGVIMAGMAVVIVLRKQR